MSIVNAFRGEKSSRMVAGFQWIGVACGFGPRSLAHR